VFIRPAALPGPPDLIHQRVQHVQFPGGHDPPEPRIGRPLDRSHSATLPTRRRAYLSRAKSRLLPVSGVSWLYPLNRQVARSATSHRHQAKRSGPVNRRPDMAEHSEPPQAAPLTGPRSAATQPTPFERFNVRASADPMPTPQTAPASRTNVAHNSVSVTSCHSGVRLPSQSAVRLVPILISKEPLYGITRPSSLGSKVRGHWSRGDGPDWRDAVSHAGAALRVGRLSPSRTKPPVEAAALERAMRRCPID
jgi:hypothetical protein